MPRNTCKSSYIPIKPLGENFVYVSGQNGQVSRLDRPNEWVKFKKFQQKFGEFERAQVRGFF